MITHVAIKQGEKVFSLPKPNRHHHILHSGMMGERTYDDEEKEIQGFVDDQGNFLTREEAFKIATESGQINRRKDLGTYDGPLLFSEDLW